MYSPSESRRPFFLTASLVAAALLSAALWLADLSYSPKAVPYQRPVRVSSGGVRGTPSFQNGKITRVEDWLEAQGLNWGSFADSWFYSDSRNDLPLLEKVSRPVAVDPDPILKAEAERRGWPVISLR